MGFLRRGKKFSGLSSYAGGGSRMDRGRWEMLWFTSAKL